MLLMRWVWFRRELQCDKELDASTAYSICMHSDDYPPSPNTQMVEQSVGCCVPNLRAPLLPFRRHN